MDGHLNAALVAGDTAVKRLLHEFVQLELMITPFLGGQKALQFAVVVLDNVLARSSAVQPDDKQEKIDKNKIRQRAQRHCQCWSILPRSTIVPLLQLFQSLGNAADFCL